MKPIEQVLIVGAESEILNIVTQVLDKEGVQVIHKENACLSTSSKNFDVIISFSDNEKIQWNIMRELSEDFPLVLLSNEQHKVTTIGSDFADAWISVDDVNDLLYKAALKAIERRQNIKAA